MNQTFSLSRFIQLNRWFWAANGRTYTLGMVALATLTLLILGRVLTYSGYDASEAGINILYFLILAVPSAMLLGTYLFSVLHGQNPALFFLMLPASRTEKFAAAVLYSVVFILGYSLFYVVTETIFFQLANSRLPSTGNLYRSTLLGTSDEWVSRITSFCYVLLVTTALTLLGSLYFRRGVMVKNAVLCLGLLISLTVLYSYIVGAFFPGMYTHVTPFFGELYVTTKRGSYDGAPKLSPPFFITRIFPWLLLLAFWITARIRFN